MLLLFVCIYCSLCLSFVLFYMDLESEIKCIHPFICPVPAGVSAPAARDIGTTYLVLDWTLPTSPNGVFTGFSLRRTPRTILYSGALTSFNVTNLTVRRPLSRCISETRARFMSVFYFYFFLIFHI